MGRRSVMKEHCLVERDEKNLIYSVLLLCGVFFLKDFMDIINWHTVSMAMMARQIHKK